MLPVKVSWWSLVLLLFHLVVQVVADGVHRRESIYAVFKVPTIFRRPKNLVDNFKRKNYANLQIDVFIGSKATDSKLADFIVEDCSRQSTLVVISSLEARRHVASSRNPIAASKLKNLILVWDSALSIDLVAVKTAFGNRWNPRARVIAYVEKVDNNTATEILAYFWKHDLLNVALTFQSQTSGLVENFIYNPFLPGKLSGPRGRLEKLNSGDSMFPNKLTDLHNYTIPISVFFYFPKAIMINFKILKNGADVEVLRALSKKLNFHVDLKTANVFGISYTVQLPSGEQVGMIGDVLVNRSDIILTVQHMESTIGKRVEFTYPLLQTGYCILVPKARMMPMIARMALPFPEEIWTTVMAVVGLLLFIFTLMGEKNKFIKISELLLHHRFSNIPNRTFNRILAISCILWAYLMACFYQANFINEMILPKYYKDLDTLEELYDSNLPLMIGENMMDVLNNSEVPVFKKLAKRAIQNLVFHDCVGQLLASFNVSCGADEYISVLLAKVYTKKNSTFLTHSIKECLSLHWDVYVAKDGFPFLEKFDQLIQGLLEAGLYHKWVVDLTSQRWIRIEDPTTGQLKMKHCAGVFGVLLLGFLISTVVFILERATFGLSFKIANVLSRIKEKITMKPGSLFRKKFW